MPTGSHVGGVNLLGVAYLLLVLALVFGPILLGRKFPPHDEDEGRDDGPGGGPREPPPPPTGPSGGIPLPSAQPSRVRLRSHGRIAERMPRPSRRPTPHPPSRPRPRV